MQDPEEFSRPPISPFLAALLVLEGLALALTLTVYVPSHFFRGPLAAIPYLPSLWFAAYWFWDRDRRPRTGRMTADDIIAPPPWKDEARHRDRIVRWTARLACIAMLGLLLSSCVFLFRPFPMMTRIAPPAIPAPSPAAPSPAAPVSPTLPPG